MMSRTTYTSAPSVQVGKLKQNRLAVSPRQRRKSFRSGEAKSELGRCCWNLQPKEILIPSAKRLFQQHRSKREAAFFWIMSASAGSGHSGRQANAREVPLPDLSRCSKRSKLLDHLVSDGEDTSRNGETECLRGLEVEQKFVLGRLHHRQVARLLAFQRISLIPGRR